MNVFLQESSDSNLDIPDIHSVHYSINYYDNIIEYVSSEPVHQKKRKKNKLILFTIIFLFNPYICTSIIILLFINIAISVYFNKKSIPINKKYIPINKKYIPINKKSIPLNKKGNTIFIKNIFNEEYKKQQELIFK